MSAIADACQWLAAEVSATPDEFYAAHPGRGSMLLDGLRSQGYVRQDRRSLRICLTDKGRRLVETERPVVVEVEA